jgi:L-cystine uptake protein TcyP (sodium:dicarboxylate symporter family)
MHTKSGLPADSGKTVGKAGCADLTATQAAKMLAPKLTTMNHCFRFLRKRICAQSASLKDRFGGTRRGG